HRLLYHITGAPVGVVASRSPSSGETLCHSLSILPYEARTRFVRSSRDTGESSACVVIKHQPLLLGRFYSRGNKMSNPLERLSTRKPQAPFRQICCKQSSPTNTR